jgi:molybdopterin converting factor small subunit
MKILVHVKLFVTLRRYYPKLGIGEAMPVELDDGSTVADLIEHLRLPADIVRVVFVDGVVRGEDHLLTDGDEVNLFPPVGGG